jgi:hypothetical protein
MKNEVTQHNIIEAARKRGNRQSLASGWRGWVLIRSSQLGWTLRYRDAEDMAPERRLGAWPAGSEIWTQLV